VEGRIPSSRLGLRFGVFRYNERMEGIEFSTHALHMLQERGISQEWALMTIHSPGRTERKRNGTTHYIRAFPERGGRFLRVVVNLRVSPRRVVTAFFDRRLGKQR